MFALGQGSGRLQMSVVLLLFVFPGCGGDESSLIRKYGYTVPSIPGDIPQYVPTDPRLRGLEPREPGQKDIDLHLRYLTHHKAGFCDAAREWQACGQLMYKSFEDINTLDTSMEGKRGYWDGYTWFRNRHVVGAKELTQERGSYPVGEESR